MVAERAEDDDVRGERLRKFQLFTADDGFRVVERVIEHGAARMAEVADAVFRPAAVKESAAGGVLMRRIYLEVMGECLAQYLWILGVVLTVHTVCGLLTETGDPGLRPCARVSERRQRERGDEQQSEN